MKIITAPKFYYKEELLEQKITGLFHSNGHQIIPFSEKFDDSPVFSFNSGREYSFLEKINTAKKFAKLLDIASPNLVWGFGINSYWQFIFTEAKKRNIPVLCNMANSGFVANTFYAEKIDRFVVSSNFLKKLMIKKGASQNKIKLIRDFILPEIYKPEYESKAYIVYLGGLNPANEFGVLVEAMKKLKHIKLYVSAERIDKVEFEKIKEKKNLRNLKLTDRLKKEELHTLVKNARIIVIPSLESDYSQNSVLQSYAMGKAVLAANSGAIPEYVQDGTDGILYRHDSPEELAEKIEFLSDQSQICSEMGFIARKKVELFYTPEVYYENIMNLIADLI